LTEHQKLIRFFIRLSIGFSIMVVIAFFLLMNRSSFVFH